jgi:outer membrane protein OmpA-like peptidoglycan-associated protein
MTTENLHSRVARCGFGLVLVIGLIVLLGDRSRAVEIQKPGAIQQPKGTWQVPGEIQQPKGPWQKPGEIQVPKGIQAIKREDAGCQHRLNVGADALFAFNKSDLSPDAEETLSVLGPEITKLGNHPATIEGHTDSIGSAEYNQRLSERRANAVKEWLVSHKFIAESTPTKGYGKTRPVAPNTNPDGSDNPQGRQKNRRVEVVVDSCP